MNIKNAVINNKKKIMITALVAVAAAVIAVASASAVNATTVKSLKKIASAYVPSTATFQEMDRERGRYELDYYDKTYNEDYTVTISKKTKKVTRVERDCENCDGSATVKLSKAEAEAAVKKEFSGIKKISSVLEKDSGLYEYRVEFSGSKFHGTAYVDPSNGKIISSDYRYSKRTKDAETAGTDLISESEAESIVLKKIPGATITDIELDTHRGVKYYEGEATLSNNEYEFMINASTGEIAKWTTDTNDTDNDEDYNDNDHDDNDHDD